MTFYSVLSTAGEHANLILALRIEGIPFAFVERQIASATAPSLTGYTQVECITRIEEGESKLDLDERREMAATLEVELLDTSTGTLAGLFALNTRRQTWISANATAASTTVTTATTAGFTNGQAIYTDEETITIGTVGATLTGCTRGAFGSTAAAVYGVSTDGQSVYTVPPNWIGRRVFLYGYALDSNNKNIGFEQLLGVFIIDESPRHTGDNMWSLVCASVAQEYYERPVSVGLRQTSVTEGTWTGGARPYYTLTVDDADAFRVGSAWPVYAIVRASYDGGEAFGIHEVQGVAATTVSLYAEAEFGTSPVAIGYSELAPERMKITPIAFVGGIPKALLYILLSGEGQLGASATYDRLPGRLPSTAYDSGWRFGAAFKTTEIDVTTWESIEASRPFFCVLDAEQTVASVLKEWCLLNGMATRVTSDGKLSVFTLASPRTVAATTLGKNSVIPDSRVEVQSDESAIYPLQTLECNYNPRTKEYGASINLVDEAMIRRYPRAPRRVELSFRMIGCSDAPGNDSEFRYAPGADVPIAQMPSLLVDIVRGENGMGRRFLGLTVTMAHLALRIGDVVKLSGLPDAFSALPDMRGGTLATALARVVARRPRYNEGRIDLRLMLIDPLVVVAPAAVVASVATATLTLKTTGPEVSGASPANDYYVNCGVALIDLGAGTRNTYTVTAIPSATQVTLSATPPAAVGTRYLVFDPQGLTTADGTTSSGYTLAEIGTTVDDDGTGAVKLTVNNQPRWR